MKGFYISRVYLGLNFFIASIISIVLFSPIIILFIYSLYIWWISATTVVINATTQSVSFVAAIPEMAQFKVSGFAVTFDAAAPDVGLSFRATSPATIRKPLCLSGLIIPQQGTNISYKRFGAGPVVATFERSDGKPAAAFDLEKGEAPAQLRNASWVRLEGITSAKEDDRPDDRKPNNPCPDEIVTILPVYGPAQIGTEIRPAARGNSPSSGLLIEGTIDLFGSTRSLTHLFSGPRSIYPATSSPISIPAGARVAEYLDDGKGPHDWTGFVMTDAEAGLNVKANVKAKEFAVYRAGDSIEPETISIGLLTQLANDPLFLVISFIAGLILVAIEVFERVFLFLHDSREEGREDEETGAQTKILPVSSVEGESLSAGESGRAAGSTDP